MLAPISRLTTCVLIVMFLLELCSEGENSKKKIETMTIPKLQIEIMLYVMRDGVLHALLGRYGYMTESSACGAEPRKGHYRPTACAEAPNTNLGTLASILQNNLGSDVISELVPILPEIRKVDHATKERYVCIIPIRAVEKMKLPYYSGCLRPITAIEVADIVEVPADGSWVFNRIPMTAGEGWRDFLTQGFDLLSQ